MSETPDNDRSCEILTEALRARWPFIHSKFGDGAIEVMHGCAKFEQSCDGEPQWEDREASARYCGWIWHTLAQHSLTSSVVMADWMTCSDPQGLGDTWAAMQEGTAFQYVAYEALLLHRLSPALLDFYRTLRDLPARKLLVTSWANQRASAILNAEPCYIPGPRLYQERSDAIAERTARIVVAHQPEVVIMAGGGIAMGVQAHLIEWKFPATQIMIGSALDPLIKGKTRSGQVDPIAAREYFKDLL